MLSNGAYVGYFGQSPGWNINELSQYEKRKPRYVREWYIKLKKRMKEIKAKRDEE